MATDVQVAPIHEVQGSPVEHLYHIKVRLTQVIEFGTVLQSVLTGETPPPACGARFDAYFEGSVHGPRLRGTLTCVDHLMIRSDGRAELHIHAALTMEDGARVSFFADGLGTVDLGAGKVHLHENVTLHSSDERYRWVNTLPIWARGYLDLQMQEVHVDGYIV